MSRASKVKIGSHWKKPPTKIYDYNYNFQEGYYKPQIDHLDKRDRGIHEEAPGAQTFAERVARNCPGCLASHEPGKVTFGGHNHPDHDHPHHHSSRPTPPTRTISIPEDDSLLGPRRRPRGMSPGMSDLDGLGLDMPDPRGLGSGSRPHPRLRMPNLDDDPDWAGMGADDYGLGPSSRRPGGGLRTPDIDGMMRDLGLDNPLSKRGIKGNTSPDVLLGRDSPFMQRSIAGGAGAGSLMASSDYSNSMESSVRMKKRSYNLTAVTEKTTISN